MLSRQTFRIIPRLTRVSHRGFFDYVKSANDLDSGITLDEQARKESEANQRKKASDFKWDFIQWYERNAPNEAPEWNGIKSDYRRYEEYAATARGDAKEIDIDFAKFKSKIADPTFVDNLEIALAFEKNTLKSIKSMKTLDEWSRDSVNEFESDCSKAGDLLWAPATQGEIDEFHQKSIQGQDKDEYRRRLGEELLKDWEQFDAERLMINQATIEMNLAQNPTWAETIEDVQASRQYVHDYVIFIHQHDFLKQEKLLQFQDEKRRALFLERFETASHMSHGWTK